MEIVCISGRYVEPEIEHRLDELFAFLKNTPSSQGVRFWSSYKTPFEKMVMDKALSNGFKICDENDATQIGSSAVQHYKSVQEVNILHPEPDKLTMKAKKDLAYITGVVSGIKGPYPLVVLVAPGPSGGGRAKYAKDLARHYMIPYLDITSPKFFRRLYRAVIKVKRKMEHSKSVEDYRRKQKEQSKRKRQYRSLRDLETFLLSTEGLPRKDISVYTKPILKKTVEMIETRFRDVKDLGYISIEWVPNDDTEHLDLTVVIVWDEKIDKNGSIVSSTQMDFVVYSTETDILRTTAPGIAPIDYQFWYIKERPNGNIKRVRKPPYIAGPKHTR